MKAPKIRIIHFVENYLQITETFIYNYIIKSSNFGDIAIVTFDMINTDHFPLSDKIRIFKIKRGPSLSLKDLPRLHWWAIEKLSGRKIWYGQFRKIIEAFRPDLVHCHFGDMGVRFADFRRYEQLNTKFVTNFYGYDASELPRRDLAYAAALPKVWEGSEFILAEGPAMGERLQRLGAPADKIRLSPIIVDSGKYPVRGLPSPRKKDEILRFLLIGRFVEKKGFHLFLKAIGKIKGSLPPFKIVMIGSGPMEDTYRSIITTHALQEVVSFEGVKRLSECMNYMMEADVLVHPSVTAENGDSEGGAPTILIEAQLMGIPVISSSHADIPFVMGYHDFLAKEGDIDDLCRIIRSFIQCDSIPSKTTAGRNKALEQHDMNNTTAYRDILLKFTA